jgi:hypothetical protein
MRWHKLLEQPNQPRVHVFIFIRNSQTNDPLTFQVCPELLRKLVAVYPFHNEDQIRPLEQLGGNRLA